MIIGPTVFVSCAGYTVKSMSPDPRRVPFGAPRIGFHLNPEAFWLYNPLGQKIASGNRVEDFFLRPAC